MQNRTEKLKFLNSVFNESNTDSLKSLSRKFCPNVLIFQQQGGGLIFSGKTNPTLPKRYQDKIMDDKELEIVLLTGGNGTTFLLPDNGRD
jgi:hypothetical protein